LEAAQALARSWAERAVGELGPVPAGAVKDALASIADLFVQRLA
jgi:hypothetical protein